LPHIKTALGLTRPRRKPIHCCSERRFLRIAKDIQNIVLCTAQGEASRVEQTSLIASLAFTIHNLEGR
jgi:hypothetical protein